MAQDDHILEELTTPKLSQELNWLPIVHIKESHDYYMQIADTINFYG
jgi:hypothetical protein